METKDTPAATFTQDQVTAIGKLIAEALKPIGAEVTELKTSVGTVAGSVEKMTEAVAALEVNSGDAGKGGGKDAGTSTSGKDGGAGSDAATALTKDDVIGVITEFMTERDSKTANEAAKAKAVDEFIATNAPKLKEVDLARRLLLNTDDNDDARKAVLDDFKSSIEKLGVGKLPDLGTATPESEGGTTGAAGADKAKAEEASKLSAIDSFAKNRAAI